MAKKASYRPVPIERLTSALLAAMWVGASKLIVAIDVAKLEMMAGLGSEDGSVVRLVRFESPMQTREFVELVVATGQALRVPVEAPMEPTGTYGDGLRALLVWRGVSVFMQSPKRVHDAREALALVVLDRARRPHHQAEVEGAALLVDARAGDAPQLEHALGHPLAVLDRIEERVQERRLPGQIVQRWQAGTRRPTRRGSARGRARGPWRSLPPSPASPARAARPGTCPCGPSLPTDRAGSRILAR